MANGNFPWSNNNLATSHVRSEAANLLLYYLWFGIILPCRAIRVG